MNVTHGPSYMKLFPRKGGNGVEMSSNESEFHDQIYRQPPCDSDRIIIDSLRPMFPQFGEAVFRECIANARRMFVGADPNAILTECINYILSGTYHEAEENNTLVALPMYHEQESNNTIVPSNEEDDVVYLRTSNSDCTVEYGLNDPSAQRTINNDVSPKLSTYDRIEKSTSSSTPVTKPTNASNCGQEGLNEPVVHLNVGQHEAVHLSEAKVNNQTPIAMPLNPCKPDAINEDKLPVVDRIDGAFETLQCMFTDVEEDYLRNLLQRWPGSPYEMLLNNACNHLLEDSNYPKKQPLSSPTDKATSKDEPVDHFFTDFSSPVTPLYQQQCLEVLDREFRMVKMKDIRMALKRFNFHYAPCKKALEEGLVAAVDKMNTAVYNVSTSSNIAPPLTGVAQAPKPKSHPEVNLHLLKCGRSPRRMPANLVPELQKEVDFVKKLKLEHTAEEDWHVALMLNTQQYEEEGQLIECGCCYGEAAFEQMVQCMDGHLFCGDCLKNYAKEAAFGQGKAHLTCMTNGCSSTFPVSQLKHCLPANILAKYEDRVKEESLSLAQVEDLVKCPACNYGAIMPPGNKVFKCQNPLCAKETCRHCKEDWSEHFGLPCKEVEKKNEKNLRLSYEEKMTMAKIRKCAKCGCEFTKSSGCNKMTCRCGTTQCYVCHKSSIAYNHFCAHPRDPGRLCQKCTSCSLWSDPSEDDDRAVKELEAEAAEEKRKLADTTADEAKRKLEDTTAPENVAKKIKLDTV